MPVFNTICNIKLPVHKYFLTLMSLKSSIPSTFFLKMSRPSPYLFLTSPETLSKLPTCRNQTPAFFLNPYRYGCIEKVKVKYCFKDTCVCVFDVLDPWYCREVYPPTIENPVVPLVRSKKKRLQKFGLSVSKIRRLQVDN